MKRLKKIPKFKREDAEREFWSTADSTEYIDWSKAEKLVLPKFCPTLLCDYPVRCLAEKIKEERIGKVVEGSSSARRRAG